MNKAVKRLRFSEEDIESLRSYYPGLSVQKIVENAVQNEIRRKQKKRLKTPF